MPVTRYLIRNVHWPLMEKLKKNKTRSYIQEMKSSQHLAWDEIKARQNEKLAALLEHAMHNVPAYIEFSGELGHHSVDPQRVLQKLPMLTKARFREQRDSFISRGIDRSSLITNRTGGSTGEPTRFYLDRCTVEHYEAARWLGLSWHDIQIGDSSVMIWGSPIELTQQQSKKYLAKERYLKNRLLISAYELKEAQIEHYVKQIRSFKPAYLYGYASALHLLAELMLARGLAIGIPLKAVVSTAESLHPHQRDAISRAFEAPVVNEYGARDGGIIAFQCTAGQMHVFAENCFLEVVSLQTGEPVPPGQPGLLLVTDLHNYAMPRLRYQLGDVVQFSRDACSCGIQFPVLDAIEGREDDMFLALDGSFVHGHYFNHIIRGMESFRTFQIIQHHPEQLTLKLVKHPEKYQAKEELQVLDGIRRSLGQEVEISVEHVDEIPPSGSGKIRYAIREFPINRVQNGSSSSV